MAALKLQLVLVSILVLDLIAFTSILPLLPSILSFYEKESVKDRNYSLLHNCVNLLNSVKVYLGVPNTERYNGVFIGGVLGSLFSFLQFMCNPIFGAISDVVGRKRVLLVTMFGTGISYFIWIKSLSFEWFFLSRIVGGICKCSVTMSTTIMSDITDESERGKGMALIGISFAVAFITGPLCGAYFAANVDFSSSKYPFTMPAVFSLSLQCLAIILTIILLPETKTAISDAEFTQGIKSAIRLINPIRLVGGCQRRSHNEISSSCNQILLIVFTFLVFFSGLEFTLTFLTYQRFGFGNRQQGLLFLYVGILMLLIQGGFMRSLKKGREKKIATSGIFMMVPSMVFIAFAYTTHMLCIGLTFFSYSAAIVVPCMTTLYSRSTNRMESGEMLGIFKSVGALSRALGPFIVCFLYWTFGSTACYLIGACAFSIPLILCYSLNDSNYKRE